MKLWAVYNGWIGWSDVHVLVIAPDEERAKALASEVLRRDAQNRRNPYPESYWTNLEAELLCEDVTQEWVSEIFE